MVDENYEGQMEVIIFEDEEGNEIYFEEELTILYNDQEYCVMISCPKESDDDHQPEEQEITITRIEYDEDGQVSYVTPEDEEFDAVVKIYEDMDEE